MSMTKNMNTMFDAQSLDEDEMYRFVQGSFHDCPYYQFGDEYRIVRKQM